VNRKQLQIKGQLIAGALLTDTANVIRELDRAGGIPQGISFEGDAGAVIAAAKQIPRDVIGDAAALMLMDAVESAGIKGKRYDAIADKGSPLEVPGLIADLKCHAMDEAGKAVIETPADPAYKLRELTRIYAPQIVTACPDAGAVDAAAWLSEPDEPELPIVSGLFDHGDRVSIVGQSKARKSFFAMQLAVSISTGTPFLNIETTAARVQLVNGEIRPGAYRRRLRRMMTAMRIDGDTLRDRLSILNSCDATAAATWESVLALAMKHRAAVCIIDPAYLLLGDEIDQMQAKSNVQAMRAFAAAGVTLIAVYHATKGMIGDRQVIDRVAGSGVYARDASTMLSLCEHATEPDHIVLAAVTRNHPPQDARTLVFQDGAFTVADGVGAVEKTSKTRSARTFTDTDIAVCFPAEPASYADMIQTVQSRLGVGIVKAKDLIARAVSSRIADVTHSGRNAFYNRRDMV
jgi:KaiC/GvpD/RAD55 family RecA-like ATPase